MYTELNFIELKEISGGGVAYNFGAMMGAELKILYCHFFVW